MGDSKMKIFVLWTACVLSLSVVAQEEGSSGEQVPLPVNEDSTADRAPAQDSVPGHVVNEDDLKVLPQLPEAQVKQDARSVQSEVYKSLYKRELKPDQREDVLDE
jgi:hypothetical protein